MYGIRGWQSVQLPVVPLQSLMDEYRWKAASSIWYDQVFAAWGSVGRSSSMGFVDQPIWIHRHTHQPIVISPPSPDVDESQSSSISHSGSRSIYSGSASPDASSTSSSVIAPAARISLPIQLAPYDEHHSTQRLLLRHESTHQPSPPPASTKTHHHHPPAPQISQAYRKYLRTYRCKQCDYVAKSKDDYWSHTRLHIKQHKLLACPKCLFVTEHKHHLEYHLRNHFGSKPYKCPKCPYTCVNKSMLKSHAKSHTDLCEYECADCEYATKYCHSLKLHLKKRGHRAADPDLVNGFRKWSMASSSAETNVVSVGSGSS